MKLMDIMNLEKCVRNLNLSLKKLMIVPSIGVALMVAVPAQAGGCPEENDHATIQKTANISVHGDIRDKFDVFNINMPVFLKVEQITEGKEHEGAKLLYMKYMRVNNVTELATMTKMLAKDGGLGASAANKLIVASWVTDAKVARIMEPLLKDVNDKTSTQKEGLMYKAREFNGVFDEETVERMAELGSYEPVAFHTYGMKKKDQTPVWLKTLGVVGFGINMAEKLIYIFDDNRWGSGSWDFDIGGFDF